MPGVLAIDIGGTKLAAGRVSPDGQLLARAQGPTAGASADELFAGLMAVVDQVRTGDEAVCGVGCGGPMAAGGAHVSPLNIPQWREFPLLGRLRDALGIPVTIDNDAKALALGEGWVGAAAGERNYIGMVVSTGVGGGIVVDGRLVDGDTGNAGHIGHVVVVPDGAECACGGRGCLEAEASGSGIARWSGAPASDAGPEIKARTGLLVGRAVASAVTLLDLRLAVVAGSVALGFGDAFFAAAQAELDRLCLLSYARGARIVPATLGDAAPLIGAAAVALRAPGSGR